MYSKEGMADFFNGPKVDVICSHLTLLSSEKIVAERGFLAPLFLQQRMKVEKAAQHARALFSDRSASDGLGH